MSYAPIFVREGSIGTNTVDYIKGEATFDWSIGQAKTRATADRTMFTAARTTEAFSLLHHFLSQICAQLLNAWKYGYNTYVLRPIYLWINKNGSLFFKTIFFSEKFQILYSRIIKCKVRKGKIYKKFKI